MDDQTTGPAATYTHGHSRVVTSAMAMRSAEREGAFFLRRLRPGMGVLDVGCGPGSITVGVDREESAVTAATPTMTKDDLMAHGDAIRFLPLLKGDRFACAHYWVQLRPDCWAIVQGQRPLIMSPGPEPRPHVKAHFEEIVRFDLSARLREIRAPSLVVCGRQDPIAPCDRCVAMHEGIPGSEVLLLEHSAHGVAVPDLALFRETVLRFLARLRDGRMAV